jgi:hypothetical protein
VRENGKIPSIKPGNMVSRTLNPKITLAIQSNPFTLGHRQAIRNSVRLGEMELSQKGVGTANNTEYDDDATHVMR